MNAGLWALTALIVAAAYGIRRLLRHFDRRVDQTMDRWAASYNIDDSAEERKKLSSLFSRERPARDGLTAVEQSRILARLEAELDQRAIRAIDDAYGHRRWAE